MLCVEYQMKTGIHVNVHVHVVVNMCIVKVHVVR